MAADSPLASASYDQPLAESGTEIAHDKPAHPTFLLQHQEASKTVIIGFARVLFHAKAHSGVGIFQLAPIAVVKRVAGIARTYTVSFPVIERDVCAVVHASPKSFLPFPLVSLYVSLWLDADEKRQNAQHLFADAGDETQFAQGLYGSVQIDVGMNLLHRLFGKGGHLHQRFGRGIVDVQRMFVQKPQLLNPLVAVASLFLVFILGHGCDKVLPSIRQQPLSACMVQETEAEDEKHNQSRHLILSVGR